MDLKKSKTGQTVIVGIMISITVFIAAVALIEPVKSVVIDSRDATHLDCNNETISVGQQGACIVTDWYLPIWFGVSIFAALGYITGKYLKII